MSKIYFNTESIIEEIAINNCQRAFRKFFDLYYSKSLHLAFTVLQNDEAAQDVVLEVFEKVWEQRAGLTEIKNVTSYLVILVRNKSIDELRKRKDLITLEIGESDFIGKVSFEHPENILLDKELFEKIDAAVLHLPEKCRLVYRLIKEDGLKYKEVAELLNLSTKTIDNHMSTAITRIRQEVETYLNEDKKYSWQIVRSILSILPI